MREWRSMEAADAFQVAEVHPDEERTTDDVLVRREAPIAAVGAVVAVVAHHEVVARRHLARDTARVVLAVIAIREVFRADDEWRHGRVIENAVLAPIQIFFEL